MQRQKMCLQDKLERLQMDKIKKGLNIEPLMPLNAALANFTLLVSYIEDNQPKEHTDRTLGYMIESLQRYKDNMKGGRKKSRKNRR